MKGTPNLMLVGSGTLWKPEISAVGISPSPSHRCGSGLGASSPCSISQAAAQPQSPQRVKAIPEELHWGLLPFLGAALLPLPPCAALEGSADTKGTLQKPSVRADTECVRKRVVRHKMHVQTPHACADDVCVQTGGAQASADTEHIADEHVRRLSAHATLSTRCRH